MLLSLSNEQGSSQAHFARFRQERVLERLRALTPEAPLTGVGPEFSLEWPAQPHPEWAAQVAAEVEQLRTGIREAHRLPLRFVFWAGAGESTGDKAMYEAAGLLRRGPRCFVLDSADPAKLGAVLEHIEKRHGLALPAILRSSLVVGIATAMNSFKPALNLGKLANLYEKCHLDPGSNFLCLSPAGSLLDRFGRERGFRRLGLGPGPAESTAGRHCAPLTRGSLYPLALAKQDLAIWIAGAALAAEDVHTAWRLAAFLHAQSEAGRGKITLLLPKPWIGAAAWTRREFEGARPGLAIFAQESPKLANYRSPKDSRQDRAFVAVEIKGEPAAEGHKLALLRRAGYPLAVVGVPRGAPLSRYIQFVHHAVFGVAYLRTADFAAPPEQERYECAADSIHAEAESAGGIEHTAAWQAMMNSPRQARFHDAVTLHYDRLCLELEAGGRTAPQLYAAAVKQLIEDRRIECARLTFFGDMRYSPAGAALRKRLRRAAEDLFLARLKMPVEVCEGPAEVTWDGKCFSTVLLSREQRPLAAARYGADYHVAQFLASIGVLAGRQRPVVAITLRDLREETVRGLADFFRRAGACLRR